MILSLFLSIRSAFIRHVRNTEGRQLSALRLSVGLLEYTEQTHELLMGYSQNLTFGSSNAMSRHVIYLVIR
jgi:hypothetical protein